MPLFVIMSIRLACTGRRLKVPHLASLLFLLFLFSAVQAQIDPQVTVLNGTYAGLHLPEFNQDVFLGMPYAQSTGGQNRFRIPQALTGSWNGTRDAKQYGPACPDENVEVDGVYGMGEDCLSINIVRPDGVETGEEVSGLPVVVWIHGGSYQAGTSALDYYNLTYLVQRSVEVGKPIIAASINYRKGGWGMMYSREIQGSGNANLALRDMRKGLAWVQENIEAFGGDTSRVTIWGESAGSFAVGQLLLTYGGRTDGLFHRSIQESGSATTAWYNGSDWYQPIYDKIVDQVNCTDVPDTLACLRTVDYEVLYPFMASSKVKGPGFYPTVDGDIIPNYPSILLSTGKFAHIPHLYGTNSDEGTDNAPSGGIINTDSDLRTYLQQATGFDFPPSVIDHIMTLYPDDPTVGIPLNTGTERFADKGWQYKRIAAILGDVFYHAPRLFDVRNYVKYGDETYVYRFNTRGFVNGTNETYTDLSGEIAPAYKGVAHFSEVAFVFGNPKYVGPWSDYESLSKQMGEQWVNFVYEGNPNGLYLPEWPIYGSRGEQGVNLVLQTEAQGGSYVEEDTYRLEGREYLIEWARRRHV
ncbi:Alpha/Beta hydrolase protein [Pseudomassariella vexata]|uniref:Carboxylic ester hydrolase n=1 Tax=Pseudomassariella vexata TaxID=1141098 RepID=A0A1Y2E580_9PEZI|nr:Alpha/Beta hydrolase protein [Pseudomassariella vexata]ORY66514.1 Alpha/Beta hydrolase protein [Pseudomassariella vexata]